MWSEKYIVVGDRFNGFCFDHDRLITESMLIDRVLNTQQPEHLVTLLIEQGVSMDEVSNAINLRDPFGHFFRIVQKRITPRAVKRLAHKDNTDNILVGYPVKHSDNEYTLDLILEQNSELFLDHMTGMHVQGMVLLEAARQSFLAVTEQFYLNDEDNDYYFVIKNIDSRFLSFAFPLHSIIHYEVVSYNKKEHRHAFESKVTIKQNGEVCAEFDVGFTAFLSSFIAEREMIKANEAVSRVIHHLTHQDEMANDTDIIRDNVA